MKHMVLAAILCLYLQGCAVFGIALTGVAAENVALGEDSYTNKALDYTCEQTAGTERRGDGSCSGN